LIAGGGPVGLAVALDLGWRGVPCLLVEQGDGERVQPKMLFVSVRTMEICRRWGIDHKIRNWGFPEDFPHDNIFVTTLAGHEIARLPSPPFKDRKPLSVSPTNQWHCPQTWFDPILRDSAREFPEVELRYHTKLEDFEDKGDRVETVIVGPNGTRETIECDWLVACDGFRSLARDKLGFAMRGRDPVDKSANLMVRIPKLSQYHDKGDAARYIMVGDVGTWATFVAVDGKSLWRITLYGTEGFDPYEADYHEYIRKALGADWPYELESVEKWTRRGMVAGGFMKGRVLMAGDAVHAMPPNGGFGMNTGIADANDLGWKLVAMHRGWGGEKLVDTYDAERRPVGARAVAEALRDYDRLTSNTRYPNIAEDTEEGARVRRELGARLGSANRRAWEPIGIHLGYKYDSPIVIPDGTPAPEDDEFEYTPTTRPGSRAPHAWLRDNSSTLDLYGRNHTLVCLNGENDAAKLLAAAASRRMPLDVRHIAEPHVRELYERNMVLVRPDGHVAWRGDRLDDDPLRIVDRLRGAA
jgi:2-polyprenyl-6-methoxyphenol hydroxylase-like FAD-dependent oxidoreductase